MIIEMPETIKIAAIEAWSQDEIIVLDKEDYEYTIHDVTGFQEALIALNWLDSQDIDFILELGWAAWSEEFDDYEVVQQMIDRDSTNFFNYATKTV